MKDWIQIGPTEFLSEDRIIGWNYEKDHGIVLFLGGRPSTWITHDDYIIQFLNRYATSNSSIARFLEQFHEVVPPTIQWEGDIL